MATTSGRIPFREYETSYRVFGDLKDRSHPPLVVLHGGPGAPYRYLLPIGDLASTHNIPVIFYDQIGCGDSTHLPNAERSFWSIELFLDELDNVLKYFGIQDEYVLLGNSWGGMLASEHAIRQPKGMKRLVLACTLPAEYLWAESAKKLRAEMPEGKGALLDKHEAEGTTETEEYKKLSEEFDAMHACRVRPLPDYVAEMYEMMEKDSSVAEAMFGTSDADPDGILKDWNVIDQLHKISVPTLVVHGKYDPASDEVVKPFVDNIPDVRKVRFEESSHMPQVEEREKYVQVVGDFLVQ